MMRTFLLAFALLAAAGCLPPRTDGYRAMGPAPVVAAGGVSPERAGWAEQYRKNRPSAPERYAVFPSAPRQNAFGEFDDELYHALDAQPALPRLPGDVYAMTSPAYPQYASAPAGAGDVPAPAAIAVSTPAAADAPVGVATGNHFVPLEQLVYGGDYPDIDQPDSYRLMPKDVISITVKDHPEFSGKVEIQPDGTVRPPNAPDLVRIRGLTPDQAADEIRRVLAVYVRGECLVRVQTNRAKGGYYFVFGDVLQPGRFPMGLEPIKLSDAVLAANWEANPARLDADGDDLGPSFPAANPRGRFIAPPSADLAGVMLITPHRSQPIRTVHDIRSAMLGVTADDPVVRPGQIIVVPSLRADRNRRLGIPMPSQARLPGSGFSGASTPARLPEVFPDNGPADYLPMAAPAISEVEANMAQAFNANLNETAVPPEYGEGYEVHLGEAAVARRELAGEVVVEQCDTPPSRPGRVVRQRGSGSGETWKKGF